jgi:hypothetical protein
MLRNKVGNRLVANVLCLVPDKEISPIDHPFVPNKFQLEACDSCVLKVVAIRHILVAHHARLPSRAR